MRVYAVMGYNYEHAELCEIFVNELDAKKYVASYEPDGEGWIHVREGSYLLSLDIQPRELRTAWHG